MFFSFAYKGGSLSASFDGLREPLLKHRVALSNLSWKASFLELQD